VTHASNSDYEYYESQARARDLLHLITQAADDLANAAEHYHEYTADGKQVIASHAAALLGLLGALKKIGELSAELDRRDDALLEARADEARASYDAE